MKHTPGPWEVTGHNKLFIEPLSLKCHYDELHETCQHCNVTKHIDINNGSQIYTSRSKKEAQANARLIAKAPVMLENLKYIEYAFSIYELATLDNEEILSINITVKAAKDISKIMLDLC